MPDIIRLDEGYRFDEGHFFDSPPSFPHAWEIEAKGQTMNGDRIPKAKGPYLDMLIKVRDNIEIEGPKFGLAVDAIASVKAKVTNQIARHTTTVNAEAALDSARADEAAGQTETSFFLREKLADWKRMAGFSQAIADALGLGGSSTPKTLPTKVSFKLKVLAGEVRVDWQKSGLDGVQIFAITAGQPPQMIGMDTSSPYLDSRPLAVPGTMEVRRYMLRGVVKDAVVTEDSDVQEIKFTG